MSIFRAYDIRGRYPSEINKEITFKIGSAFGKFIKGKRIVVGCDARESSPDLKDALMSGLFRTGKEIIDIGLSTTPMFYFAANHLDADGGVMITASHLGPEFNGLKLVESGGLSLTYDTGIGTIEKMIEKEKYEPGDYEVTKKDVKEDYLKFLINKRINIKGKIVVDTGNGMIGLVIKDVLKRIGIDYKGLYLDVDCSFPNHEANPIKEETLKDLKEVVKKEKALFGIAFDGDGDRIGIVNEMGEVVPGDFLIALIAKNILKRGPAKILYDLRSSKIVPEVITGMGGTPVKSRVGHSFISRRMKEEDIEFGGELSGHFYFKKTFYVESSILALINILELVSGTGKKLSELVKPLEKYYKSGEINFEVNNKERKLKEIERVYREKGAKIEKIDGITVEFENWWFNLRPSNTEDLIRLNLEAKTKELMEEKLEEVEKIIKA